MREQRNSNIRTAVTEQLQHLQMLMHRMAFRGLLGNGKSVYNRFRGQGRVLAMLKSKPVISQKELAELLNMSKQSLAELLVKLEKVGYIARRPSEEDRRSTVVQLLPAGAIAAEEMERQDGSMRILECLDDEELERFGEYLSRVIRSCEEFFPDEDYEERRRKLERFMADPVGYGKSFHPEGK